MAATRCRQSSSNRSSSSACLADPDRFGVHALLPSDPLLADEPRPLEHRHVLLHGREAHPVGAGERRHRTLPLDHPGEDVAPGGVREGVEDQVDLRLRRLRLYNHLVAG